MWTGLKADNRINYLPCAKHIDENITNPSMKLEFRLQILSRF